MGGFKGRQTGFQLQQGGGILKLRSGRIRDVEELRKGLQLQ